MWDGERRMGTGQGPGMLGEDRAGTGDMGWGLGMQDGGSGMGLWQGWGDAGWRCGRDGDRVGTGDAG